MPLHGTNNPLKFKNSIMKEGQGTASVYINDEQAKQALENLERKAKDLRKAMTEAGKLNDLSGYNKLKKELSDVEKEMKQIKKETFDVQKVLKNLNGTNLRDLQRAQMQITAELKKMERGTAEYVAKSKQLQLVTAEVRKAKTEMTGLNAQSSGGFFGKLAGGFNKYFGVITAAIASFTGVAFSIKKAVDAFNEFEQSVANLSALTGLTGDDLKFLSDRAKELSVGMTESGVRITNSATDIVEGFKLMGSARPELLENKDALAKVTEAALVLSAAAGIDMQSAVTATAASMNQFNLTAEDSNMIINSLAAGSLKGSSEIADLTESFKNVGTVAYYSNLTMEDTVAVLETLAEKQLKGEEAGTQLKTSLIAMKAAGLGYQSGVFNMRDALVELKAKMDAAAPGFERDSKLIEVFGKRNITVGTILTNNIERFDYFSQAVRGTNTAIEQANVNTNTNAAKLAQAKNRAHEVAIELGEKLAPAMTAFTGFGTKLLKVIAAVVDVFIKYKAVLIPVAAAIAAYTIVITTVTIAKKAYAFAVKMATAETKIFNQTLKSNIFGLIAAGIAAAVAAILEFVSAQRTLTQYEEKLQTIRKDALEASKQNILQTKQQQIEAKALFSSLKNENTQQSDKLVIIDKINKMLKNEHIPMLINEKTSVNDITKAEKLLNASMLDNMKLRANQIQLEAKMKLGSEALLSADRAENERMIAALVAKSVASEEKLDGIRKTVRDYQSDIFGESNTKGFVQAWSDILQDAVAAGDIEMSDYLDEIPIKLAKKRDEFKKTAEDYGKQAEKFIVKTPPIEEIVPPGSGNGSGDDKSIKDAEDKLKAIQAITAKYNQQFFNDALIESEKEVQLVKDKYDKEINDVGITEKVIADIKAKGWGNLNDTEKAMWAAYDANREAMHAEVEAKEKEHQDKLEQAKLAAQEEIYLATLDGEEAEMVSAMQKYDKLFELAYQNGVDTTKLKETMDKEMGLIHKKYLDEEVAKTKDAEEKKKALRRKYLEAAVDITTTLSNFVSSMKEDELADAEGNEKKQKEIKKKYADLEMGITIGKIIAQTALAAMTAYASYSSMPAVAIVMAAAAAAAGGLEIALAIKERNRIKSLAEGGDTGPGYDYTDHTGQRVAGVVHQNEYVIPTWLRKNPQVAAYENIIEAMRVSRTGYAAGGAATSTNTVSQPQIITMTDPQLLAVMMEVSKKLDNPTRAKVVYSDFENMEAKVSDARSNFGS